MAKAAEKGFQSIVASNPMNKNTLYMIFMNKMLSSETFLIEILLMRWRTKRIHFKPPYDIFCFFQDLFKGHSEILRKGEPHLLANFTEAAY